MRAGDVTRADMFAVLKPIWTTKRETARGAKHRIGKILGGVDPTTFAVDRKVAFVAACRRFLHIDIAE